MPHSGERRVLPPTMSTPSALTLADQSNFPGSTAGSIRPSSTSIGSLIIRLADRILQHFPFRPLPNEMVISAIGLRVPGIIFTFPALLLRPARRPASYRDSNSLEM